MKYRIKEIIRKDGTKLYVIQKYHYIFGWDDCGYKMTKPNYIHSTLIDAKSHLDRIKNTVVESVKYHY